MAARLAERIGPQRIGIGSDLCQDHGDAVIGWMRDGRWTFAAAANPNGPAVLPPQPAWFRSNADFPGIRRGLVTAGFGAAEADGIMGENWMRFLRKALSGGEAAA